MFDDMKVKDVVNLVNALQKKQTNEPELWSVGKNYFIRTVTMYVVGKLQVVNSNELLLTNASWVADTGRFHNCLRDGVFNEVEPFVTDVIVNRTAIIDACEWIHELPTHQK